MVLGRDAVFRHERQPAVRLHPEQSLLRHDDRDHFNMTFTVKAHKVIGALRVYECHTMTGIRGSRSMPLVDVICKRSHSQEPLHGGVLQTDGPDVYTEGAEEVPPDHNPQSRHQPAAEQDDQPQRPIRPSGTRWVGAPWQSFPVAQPCMNLSRWQVHDNVDVPGHGQAIRRAQSRLADQ